MDVTVHHNNIMLLNSYNCEQSMKPILKLSKISYGYHTAGGEILSLKDISFDVKKDEFLAIVGPSGCGKSTLLNILAGLLEPETGTIEFENPDGSIKYPSIGYMLQRDELLPWRTIIENVTLGLEIAHKLNTDSLDEASQLLHKYGLYSFKNAKPSELSGGMRQRAALIRTLLLNPQILLLDEPFSALDYQTRLNVSYEISQILKTEEKTAILVTHDLSEAISLADRIIILSKRPATVSKIMDIKLTKVTDTPQAARNAIEFPSYFNELWKELNQ